MGEGRGGRGGGAWKGRCGILRVSRIFERRPKSGGGHVMRARGGRRRVPDRLKTRTIGEGAEKGPSRGWGPALVK